MPRRDATLLTLLRRHLLARLLHAALHSPAPKLIPLEFSIERSCESTFISGCVGVVPDRVRNPWCDGVARVARRPLSLRIRDDAAVATLDRDKLPPRREP